MRILSPVIYLSLAAISGNVPALAQEPPLAPAIKHSAAADTSGGSKALQGNVSALENNFRLNRNDDTAGNSIKVSLPANAIIPGFVANEPLVGNTHSEQVPPEVYRGWIDKNHPQLRATVANTDIVEVAGQWDNAAKTLNKFDLPYQHIKARGINEQILSQAKVLIINCAGEVKRDKLQAIRDFVGRGGYLMTTDWALDNMLTQTFPGYLEWNKGVNKVDVYQADFINPEPVLATGAVRHAFWKLDLSAHLVRVLRPSAVKVLVTSRRLASEDPDHTGVLACAFPFGRGYVLHMVGHFDNNAKIAIGNFLPDPSPVGISLRQAIAANFVVAGLEGRRPF